MVAHAFPVPELPEDNLIVNPWFRSASDPRVYGFDGWTLPMTDGVTWGLSQKESNPSPDIVVSGVCGSQQVYCGTAARWAAQSGVVYPNIDVFAYQVVAADPSHRQLKFFTHYVSHLVEVGAVNIYGGDSSEGPWELVWVPFYLSEDEMIIPESRDGQDLWEETGFREWNIEQGYPYYKIELHSRLPEAPFGIYGVGFKITGIYFATAFTNEPGSVPPTPGSASSLSPTAEATVVAVETIPATAVATVPDPTPRANSVADSEAAVQGVTTLTAETISATEIILAWNEGQNNSRGFRLERSLNGTTGWEIITTFGSNAIKYTDSGLPPDTVYYYRLRASQETTSNVVSARTLPLPEPAIVAPSSLQAVSELPLQVKLQWSDLADNEAGFAIERSPDGQNFTIIKIVGQNVNSFMDTDLVPGTYYYRVRSYRNDIFSDYSEIISATVSARVPETEVGPADEGESGQAGLTETSGQSGASTLPRQDYPIALTMAFVIFLAGTGLLATWVWRHR